MENFVLNGVMETLRKINGTRDAFKFLSTTPAALLAAVEVLLGEGIR